MRTTWIAACVTLVMGTGVAQEPNAQPAPETAPEGEAAAEAMTVERLDALIARVGEEVRADANGRAWAFTLFERPVTVVADPAADRMRIMTPVADASGLGRAELERLMQANFDTALDARYALAHGVVWGCFVHPLSALDDDQFLSGLGQTVNVALTFGGSFSSGALAFGGGDSQALMERERLESLKKKGRGI